MSTQKSASIFLLAIATITFSACDIEEIVMDHVALIRSLSECPDDPNELDIYKVVEQMPRFPNAECEALGSSSEKKRCADEKMLEFIYEELIYPDIARENNVEGTVVISFVVEQNGYICQAEVVRDIGAQCGQEALRLVNLMNERGLRWIPGRQRGEVVRVQFNLPIKFRLE